MLRQYAEEPFRIKGWEASDLLGVARVTRPYADRLPSRNLYVATAVRILQERDRPFISDLLRHQEGLIAPGGDHVL